MHIVIAVDNRSGDGRSQYCFIADKPGRTSASLHIDTSQFRRYARVVHSFARTALTVPAACKNCPFLWPCHPHENLHAERLLKVASTERRLFVEADKSAAIARIFVVVQLLASELKNSLVKRLRHLELKDDWVRS